MLSGPGQFAENKLMKSILERSLHMCYRKYACILPTRFTTLTTPEIPEFPAAPKIAMKLLMAANFLDW